MTSLGVRLVEIAELLGVTKQRAHQIAEEKGFPAPVAGTLAAEFGVARGTGVGEALARREALAPNREVTSAHASAWEAKASLSLGSTG
jgi:hypothetical protein